MKEYTDHDSMACFAEAWGGQLVREIPHAGYDQIGGTHGSESQSRCLHQAATIYPCQRMRIILMYNINVPAHELHLQPQDSWVVFVVQENESNSVATRGPNKLSAKEHVSIIVDCPNPCKNFAKMGVEAYLITTTMSATKCHQA